MFKPIFLRRGGEVSLSYTDEGCRGNRGRAPIKFMSLPGVRDRAMEEQVLSQHLVQFGKFAGHTFQWLLTNVLGYAAWIVSELDKEQESSSNISVSKFRLKDYMLMLPEGREAVEVKRRQEEDRKQKRAETTPTPMPQAKPSVRTPVPITTVLTRPTSGVTGVCSRTPTPPASPGLVSPELVVSIMRLSPRPFEAAQRRMFTSAPKKISVPCIPGRRSGMSNCYRIFVILNLCFMTA